MTSKATADFWQALERLPHDIQNQAKEKFRLWQRNPFHPSLHFKELHPGLWSARITLSHRALARRRGELITFLDRDPRGIQSTDQYLIPLLVSRRFRSV
jgi:hypothetical protein